METARLHFLEPANSSFKEEQFDRTLSPLGGVSETSDQVKVLDWDVGVNKLISDSEKNHAGREIKAIRGRVRRRCPGAAGKRRARTNRNHFINQHVTCKTANASPRFAVPKS